MAIYHFVSIVYDEGLPIIWKWQSRRYSIDRRRPRLSSPIYRELFQRFAQGSSAITFFQLDEMSLFLSRMVPRATARTTFGYHASRSYPAWELRCMEIHICENSESPSA